MLDLLLLPAALLMALGLRAVHRGDHRLHGHLMAMGFTAVALRFAIRGGDLPRTVLFPCLALAGLAGTTLLLGRNALAWRENRSQRSHAPRIHRAAGILTLVAASLAGVAWLLRSWF